jgi:hypothetical protein
VSTPSIAAITTADKRHETLSGRAAMEYKMTKIFILSSTILLLTLTGCYAGPGYGYRGYSERGYDDRGYADRNYGDHGNPQWGYDERRGHDDDGGRQ